MNVFDGGISCVWNEKLDAGVWNERECVCGEGTSDSFKRIGSSRQFFSVNRLFDSLTLALIKGMVSDFS